VQELEDLPNHLQQDLLEYVRELRSAKPRGVLGRELLQFAGTITKDDAEAMRKAIEAGCEQVDANEW
jgi:hypothetical protein